MKSKDNHVKSICIFFNFERIFFWKNYSVMSESIEITFNFLRVFLFKW